MYLCLCVGRVHVLGNQVGRGCGRMDMVWGRGGVGCEYVVRVCSKCGRVVCTRDVIEVCDRG